MTSWNIGLNSPHIDIAGSPHTRIGVLAGPGTGKTTYGLLRRVQRLLEEGIQGKRIAVFSFTRTAARDIANKLVEALGDDAADVQTGTLHAFCLSVLSQEDTLAILGRKPRMLLDHEKDLMLRDLPGEFGDLNGRRNLLLDYEAAWATSPDSHPSSPNAAQSLFESQMLDWLTLHKAMLVGEVIPLAYQYLGRTPTSPTLSAFEHVLVDEYQDLNKAEQGIVNFLVRHDNGSLCVVGDDDQSIYRFRHAFPDGIREFCRDPTHEVHTIVQCGRCPEPILSMANSLITRAPNRAKPPMTALSSSAADVAIVQWNNLGDEIEGLCASIVGDVASGRHAAGEILVLVNRRRIGEPIAARLAELEVPAHSFFQEDSVRTVEAQLVVAALRYLVEPDAPSLRVAMGSGSADGRTASYRRFLATAVRQMRMTVLDGAEAVRLRQPGLTSFQALRNALQRFREVLTGAPVELEALVDYLLPEGQASTESLRELALPLLDRPDLATFVNDLVREVTQQDVPSDPAYVRVMSMHKSKGLTSKVVYVAGLAEGIVPNHDAATDPEEMEEQRRLFYVAMTRASERLVLSGSVRMQVGLARQLEAVVGTNYRWQDGARTVNVQSSRFLSQLGPTAPRAVRGDIWLAG